MLLLDSCLVSRLTELGLTKEKLLKVWKLADLQILWANMGRLLTEVLVMHKGCMKGVESKVMDTGWPVFDWIGVNRNLGRGVSSSL